MKQILLFLTVVFLTGAQAFADNNQVYDRIMESNTIRCGYYIWPPYITKDPNTGKLGGVLYDQMEYLGKRLSLKIDWVSEVNFDVLFEGFQTGRYDMICGPLVPAPERARASDFTIPVLYGMYYMFAQEGDTRFDNNYDKANDPAIRYATLDGDMGAFIGEDKFPLAEKVGLGQNAANTDGLLMVSMGKADVTTLDTVGAGNFMKANPNKIRQVKGPPVGVFALAYPIPVGEEKLKSMLNHTLDTMLDSGYFDEIFKNHPDFSASLLKAAPHYAASDTK